jgi:hypothetical protein
VRKLLVGVVIVALILIGGDLVAKKVVEGRLASAAEGDFGVDEVSVDIAGFPFLTQVVQNHFDRVAFSTPGVDAGASGSAVRVEDIEVTLRDVETSDGYRRATAASVTGSGFVPYSAFDPFEGVTVAYGGTAPDGSGYLVVSAPGLSSGSVRVLPSAADGLSLDLGALTVISSSLPRTVRSFIGSPLTLAGLPDGLAIDEIDATEDGLNVRLTGSDITIAG